jgi:phage tail-like protein
MSFPSPIYGQSKYGTFLYGTTTLVDILANDFAVRRGAEGPQVVITWASPTSVSHIDKVRLVRKEFDYPQDINDGVTLYEGADFDHYYGDLEVVENRYFYYTLFSHRVADDTWYFASETQGFSVALDSQQFIRRLFKWLPEIHRDLDRIDREADMVALDETQETTGDLKGEFFHLDEDGSTDRGQLERFLRWLEVELGAVKGFIDNLPTVYDVDSCPEDLLPHLAAITGAVINWDIPLPRRRLEIKYAIQVYKTKGTVPGIERIVWTVTGFHALVDPWYDNILLTNTEGRTTCPFTDDVRAWKLYESFGDVISRVIDPEGMFMFKNFGIFARMDPRATLTQAQVEKVQRILADFIPALSRADLFFLDPLNEEEWNILDFDEGVGVKDFLVNWLFTNAASKVTNSLHYVAAQYP